MLLATNTPLIKYYTVQKWSAVLIIKGKWMEGTKIHSDTVWTPYSLKKLFDFNGWFLRVQHRNAGSGPPGTHKDMRNTFSKLLWLTRRLLPHYLSQNRSICGHFDHNSIILSANPIYKAPWTALRSLSGCLDHTLWKTLCKLVFGLTSEVQCG